MSATIHLMRHGSIEGHETRRYIGQMDVPLDRNGRDQAARWREKLKHLSFSGVYASDLARAVETARIVSGIGQPEPVPELRELALGEWEGRNVDEMRADRPLAYEARGMNIAGYRTPGGESYADLSRRVMPEFRDILRKAEGDVLVVAHAGVNRVILCRLLGMPLKNLFRLGQDYGCLNLISVKAGKPFVKAVNILT